MKYEILDYDVCFYKGGYSVKDIIPTGIVIYTNTSKSSIGKKLNLDPYKIDVHESQGILYINYAGMPYCALKSL